MIIHKILMNYLNNRERGRGRCSHHLSPLKKLVKQYLDHNQEGKQIQKTTSCFLFIFPSVYSLIICHHLYLLKFIVFFPRNNVTRYFGGNNEDNSTLFLLYSSVFLKNICLTFRISQLEEREIANLSKNSSIIIDEYVRKGISIACFIFARCLHLGLGVKMDCEEAFKYYSKVGLSVLN